MLNHRIDPSIRVGRFLLDDILRALPQRYYWLGNVSRPQWVTEPLLTEILACLHEAGAVTLHLPERNRISPTVVYQQHGSILSRDCLRKQLTRSDVDLMLEEVIEKATRLNRDPRSPYRYEKLWLFGSCLSDVEHPGGVDLGLEAWSHEECAEIPETFGHLDGNPWYIHDASRRLLRPKRGVHVFFTHHRYMKRMCSPYRLIWTAGDGRVEGSVVAPSPDKQHLKNWKHFCGLKRKAQAEADKLVERIRAVKQWPKVKVNYFPDEPALSREEWVELQRNEYVLLAAHLLCLPEGALRTRIEEAYQPVLASEQGEAAREIVPAYVNASRQFGLWKYRADGRLVRSE